MSPEPLRVVIVTGLSGAGKSTAVHALEDLGFFCVDNLPPPVLEPTLKALYSRGIARAAFGVDVRVGGFLEDAEGVIDGLLSSGTADMRVLFLDAADEALLKRFNSTRRPHPLSASAASPQHESGAVIDGIRLERSRLAPLRLRATLVLDSTDLTVHELRKKVIEAIATAEERATRMSTRVMSFGFKHGVPFDADVVLDVRFLDNPHFVEHLRPLSGLDAPVRDYVLASADAKAFLGRAKDLLSFCLPRFEAEGKAYLTIALGCTGGRHRSVTLAERLATELAGQMGRRPSVVHRDLIRSDSLPTATGEESP